MDFEILLSSLLENTKNDTKRINDIYNTHKNWSDCNSDYNNGVLEGIYRTLEVTATLLTDIMNSKETTEDQKDILQKLSSWFSSQSFIYKQIIDKILHSKEN